MAIKIPKDLPPGARVHGVKRPRIETPEQIEKRKQRQNLAAAKKRAEKLEQQKAEGYFESLGKKLDDESCESYFISLVGSHSATYRKGLWINNPTNYPGREHIDIKKLGKIWFKTFHAWLNYLEKKKQYENTKPLRLSTHALCDYLFLYLPWWMEIHPDREIEYPKSPKDFQRFLFVNRVTVGDGDEINQALPKTFLDLLAKRKVTPDSKNRVILHLEKYFNFVISAFEDDEDITFNQMTSPFKRGTDFYKVKKRTKTNKEPFYENIYPYLVHYSQCVEAFGEHLLQLAYEKNIFAHNNMQTNGFKCEDFGYVPYFRFRGQIYKIDWVPNVFDIKNRNIVNNPAGKAGIYVSGRKINSGGSEIKTIKLPALTTLRLLIGMLESGLRGQSIQWLDRDTWDSSTLKDGDLSELYTNRPKECFTSLFVNTDKSKDTGFNTFISWRLRRSFKSEEHFQNYVALTEPSEEVFYEKRTHSRFGKVMPLFKSTIGKYPVSDTSYQKKWVSFLVGFQTFYNKAMNLEEPLKFVTVSKSEDRHPAIVSAPSKNINFSPITILANQTPHACRSTYATLKDGDFEVSEIADQIGHGNTLSTVYYQRPEAKRLIKKLEKFEMSLFSDRVGIHPEREDSAVRRSFSANRESSIVNHGFVPGVSFWKTEDLNEEEDDVLDLLRESPANAIKWHETHVCPVGNQCPTDIVEKIGGFKRCGICPLAAKCVDHLPGIAAKKRELVERIRTLSKRLDKLKAKYPARTEFTDGLHTEIELDARELSGWTLSEEVLKNRLSEIKGGLSNDSYHVDAPELVKKHLEIITKDIGAGEFLLSRIADSAQYPTLESEEVRARASIIVRTLLAQGGGVNEALAFTLSPGDDLSVVFGLIGPLLKAKGITQENFILELNKSVDINSIVEQSKAIKFGREG